MIWRDKDANTGWNSAADSTLEQRRYHCQNWRSDVSVVLTDTGTQVESIKYAAYGNPTCVPAGDVDQSGTTDASDASAVSSWGSYEARADLNLDGVVDSADTTLVTGLSGTTAGRGVLSRNDTASRKGYAGYESDATADAGGARFWHVRHRVLDSTLGRWTRRDPAGYVDGVNQIAYGDGASINGLDFSGLWWWIPLLPKRIGSCLLPRGDCVDIRPPTPADPCAGLKPGQRGRRFSDCYGSAVDCAACCAQASNDEAAYEARRHPYAICRCGTSETCRAAEFVDHVRRVQEIAAEALICETICRSYSSASAEY